jgi:hypothetical protein
MRRKITLGTVVVVCLGVGLAAQAARDEVMKAEQAFTDARIKGDKAAYARLLADEFTWTTRAGVTTTKQQRVEALQATKATSESFDEIRVYGDAAVVIGTAKPTQDGKPVPVRFLRVWAKRDGRWQAVVHQTTQLPK